MSKQAYAAFDLGAESGRAMLATLHDGRLELEQAHRFANLPQMLPSGYHWNLLELWRNLVEGLTHCGRLAKKQGAPLVGLGVDTWGVDFGLIGPSGQLLGLPYAYRDARNSGAFDQVMAKLGKQTVYQATGVQFMALNSLYQLYAQYEAEPTSVEKAKHLLFMPDLLHYFFTGQAVNEATIASTSQMVDPRTGRWSIQLLESLGLPTQMLGAIAPAGTRIGSLDASIANQADVDELAVIAPGGHDTACAVAAAPVDVSKTPNWAYLSSGTWSLMGVELDQPHISDQAMQADFTNERGVAGKIRFLKNIIGLWLVQEVRRDFVVRGEAYDYPTLTQLAADAQPFRMLLNTGYAPFAAPGDMCAKIADYAEATRQPAPETPGQFVRVCLESLAMTYRRTLMDLEKVLDVSIEVLHIVGGGGKNDLLCQMTADALGRPVIVGPFEATAVGNALTQAMGLGVVRDLADIRAIVRRSFRPHTLQPHDADAFARQFDRYLALADQGSAP